MAICPHCSRDSVGARFCPYDGTPLAHLERAGARELTGGDVVDGRYRIVAELGRGGIGIVYLADSDALGEVAVKVLQPEVADKQSTVARFAREARLSSRFDHPHVIRVFEFGFDSAGFYFLVMELLEGRSLFEVLELEGKLAPPRAARILGQVASGLARAHELGVVHRDLKAENVMLRPLDGEHVTLMDFGLSRTDRSWAGAMMTADGQLLGTPTYMAPELWRGEKATPAADLYSFGVLAYELLAGTPPFAGASVVDLMRAHVYEAPAPLAEQDLRGPLPPGLGALIHRCLAKTPEERPRSMAEVHAELEGAGAALVRVVDDETIDRDDGARVTMLSEIELGRLGQDEIREEIARLTELRRQRLAALVPAVFPRGAPADVAALAGAVSADEEALLSLEEQLAVARAELEDMQHARRSHEATLRGELTDAAIVEAARRETLGEAELLLAGHGLGVPSDMASATRRLGDLLRGPSPELADAEALVDRLRARVDATQMVLDARYEELEARLRELPAPGGGPHPVRSLTGLDGAIEAHRAQLQRLLRR